MTTIPTWAALCAAIGTPLLAFLGVIVAQRITRRGVTELEMRSKREETGRSDLLDRAQQLFVDAALQAVVDDEPETEGSSREPVPSGRDEGSADRG